MLRSRGALLDPDEEVIEIPVWNKEHLPSWRDVLGKVRHMLIINNGKMSKDQAINETAKLLEQHWIQKTVYPMSHKIIKLRVKEEYDKYFKLRNSYYCGGRNPYKKLRQKRKEDRTLYENEIINKYEDMYENFSIRCDQLCDIKADEKMKKIYEEERGIKMSKAEEHFYHGQKARDKRHKCLSEVDQKWGKKLKVESKLKLVHTVVSEDLQLTSESDTEIMDMSKDFVPHEDESRSSYVVPKGTINVHLPVEYGTIRTSNRKVREKVYTTIAALQGEGLSLQESLKAFVTVSKQFFDCDFKRVEKGIKKEEYDEHTMPDERNVRSHVSLEETRRLDFIVQAIEKEKLKGKSITLAGDSTTRKKVGKYSVSGVHLGKDNILPLPTVSVTRETAENVAETVAMPLQILGIASGKKACDIYGHIDTHMTDSVKHNKKLSANLAEKYEREVPAGQVFCTAHTASGFINSLNTSIAKIEQEMGMDNLFRSVLVNVVYEKKHGSVTAQCIYSLLALIDSEHSDMVWNYHSGFMLHLRENSIKSHLFPYKDDRFDGLPHAAAVLLYHWDHYYDWLRERSDITNKLACFSRSMEKVGYLKLSLVCLAAYGIQLVEPFNSTIKNKVTTHSALVQFFSDLSGALLVPFDSSFFDFMKPALPFTTKLLSDVVNHTYSTEVTEAVHNYAETMINDAVQLINYLRPGILKILKQQRKEYYLQNETEFPVKKQAENIDDVPVHNLGMERYCGKDASLIDKFKTVEAASRAKIIKGSQDLMTKATNTKPLSEYRKKTQQIKELKLDWSQRQEALHQEGLSEKQAQIIQKEVFKNKVLRELKTVQGPFTCSEEVDQFTNKDITENEKQNRLKLEIQYARETSVLIPKDHQMFKIMTTTDAKRKIKSSSEFANNLKLLFGKTSEQIDENVDNTVNLFRSSISNLQL